MAFSDVCLYCVAHASSDEHVHSEALGCKEIIKDCVCSSCNCTFGHSFEGTFINGLALFLNFFKIPNGEGVIPSLRLQGKIGNEEIEFRVTGDGKADIHPTLLRAEKKPSGQEKEFKIFQKAQETEIEKNLRSRHSDLVWSRLQGPEVKQIIAVQTGFDASSKQGALDPYKGRFTPLFLSGSPVILKRESLLPYPMPEYEFAELLRRGEMGTLRQAVGAANN